MTVTVESLCTFEKNEKGEYAENAGMREYVKFTAHEEEQYCRAVTTGNFVVKINKRETEGKSAGRGGTDPVSTVDGTI